MPVGSGRPRSACDERIQLFLKPSRDASFQLRHASRPVLGVNGGSRAVDSIGENLVNQLDHPILIRLKSQPEWQPDEAICEVRGHVE